MIRGSGLVLQANVVQQDSTIIQGQKVYGLVCTRFLYFPSGWQMLDIYAVIMEMLCCSMRGIKMQVIQTNKRNGEGFE